MSRHSHGSSVVEGICNYSRGFGLAAPIEQGATAQVLVSSALQAAYLGTESLV